MTGLFVCSIPGKVRLHKQESWICHLAPEALKMAFGIHPFSGSDFRRQALKYELVCGDDVHGGHSDQPPPRDPPTLHGTLSVSRHLMYLGLRACECRGDTSFAKSCEVTPNWV